MRIYGEKKILYYPSIKIEDGYWLRNAILYWDKVSSIVPGLKFEEFNSIEVEFLREVGIYEPIYPTEMSGNEVVCSQFCQEVKTKLKQQKRRTQNKNIHDRLYNKSEISRVHKEKMSMNTGSMLHIDKTPDSILEYLIEEGLAQKNYDGPWINMKTQDAEIYMAILAKYLAKMHGNTEIGTDISNKFMYPFVKSKRSAEMEKQLYLDLALQDILPVPNMNVPIQDLIDFKLQHETELYYFRRRIHEFQWNLKHCVDIDELRERVEMFRCEIDDDLHEIEESMNYKKILFSKKTLRTLLPLGLTAGIDIAAVQGYISSMDVVWANLLVCLASPIFNNIELQEKHLPDSSAYLFYAGRGGFIRTSRRENL